ncbi:hypothetical protein [Nonomuraea sp. SYSU D8015]|uniref:hypothetical protein n=1 Tax=Nonomuraea sp. SYSU D8015 TaxID=2593644 RepID=UPI001CB6D9A0|nr:hypothetical protein [Nonomuraea sp. SYSU D8015]
MIKAAQDARVRFEGMFLSDKMAEALLDEPQFNVCDNPETFLTCKNDPAKALCQITKIRRKPRSLPPSLDRCDPACAKIARTDSHIAQLRREIAELAQRPRAA